MPSEFDERIRDPLSVSPLASEGLTPFVTSKIFLETLRQFFLSVNHFTVKSLRERQPPLLWNIDETVSQVRLLRDVDWNPETMGKTPTVIVVDGGVQLQPVNNDAQLEGEETAEDPTLRVDLVLGRSVVWVVSPVADEARMLAWELAMLFSGFSEPLRKEYGFYNLRPGGAGNPVRIVEAEGYWGCAVPLAYSWMATQEIFEQQPRLAEVRAVQQRD